MVGTETGSYNADMSYHPDNHGEKALQTVIGLFKELVREAEQHGSLVGVEGLYNYAISTPQRMMTLLEAIGSSNLQVILDPVNLLHMGNYQKSREIIEESFALYGERILLLHAKDFVIEEGRIKTVPLGRGMLDYEHFLSTAYRHKPSIEIIIEDITGPELTESHRFLQDVLKKIGF